MKSTEASSSKDFIERAPYERPSYFYLYLFGWRECQLADTADNFVGAPPLVVNGARGTGNVVHGEIMKAGQAHLLPCSCPSGSVLQHHN